MMISDISKRSGEVFRAGVRLGLGCLICPVVASAAWEPSATKANNWETKQYAPLFALPGGADGKTVFSPTKEGTGLPQVTLKESDDTWEIIARADGDKLATNGRGDIVLSWPVPKTGNWKIELSLQNTGLDVKGGDGGVVTLTRLAAGDGVDTNTIYALGIPPSFAEGNAVTEWNDVVALQQGDHLNVRIAANIDAFGDQFVIRLRLKETAESGRTIAIRGYESFLANPPTKALRQGVPISSGLFWLGTDGGWATSEYAQSSLRLIKKYVPNLAVVLIANKPETFPEAPIYQELKIPTIIQNYGSGYEPYLKASGAFEINWEGKDLSEPGVSDLSGTAHAAAMPHPATRKAFTNLAQSAIRSGFSGFGICDMVWMWGAGRGATGYNPATIEAFRQDLQGLDAGIKVSLDGGEPKLMKLADYAKFYLGGMPTAQALGFADWKNYAPPQSRDYPGDKKDAYHPEFLLFDLLCHYEWLKMADLLGQTANAEGGFFQCMPNPEDLANGNDFLFLNALGSVFVKSEEYFNDVDFLGGAYYRYPYLTAPNQAPRQKGVVMEGGGGGNWWPYYAPEVSYVTAYELTLATQADQMEGDFWPNVRTPLEQAAKDKLTRLRFQAILAYGIGFTHAKEDAAVRPEAQFISVTSRRIFRPWGTSFIPWDWHLFNDASPDMVLAQSGFVFQGIGEEGIQLQKAEAPLVIYSPSVATEVGWKEFYSRLAAGRIKAGIMSASALTQVVRPDFQMAAPDESFRSLVLPAQPNSTLEGQLLNTEGKPVSPETVKLEGGLFGIGQLQPILLLGKTPLVGLTKVREQPLYVVLFDPSLPANSRISQHVYTYLLAQRGIQPKWKTEPETYARVYRKGDLTIVGAHESEVRAWHKISHEMPSGTFLPYAVNDTLTVDVLMRPSEKVNWLALPSGQTGEAKADADGFVRLSVDRVSCQIFYVLPASDKNKERLSDLGKRRDVLLEAFSLDGRVSQ